VITDYQSDCIDGVEELLQRIPVDTIALPDTWTDREARETLTQLAMAQSCQILWVDQTQRITFGQAELTIYVPVEQVAEESETTSGLAVQVDWQTHHILVAGTLDTAQEQLLLERETLPKLDVLVVANHGSGSSTGISLLSQLSPKCALIAVGSGRFRTPSDAVLTRLAGIDCDVYRTDLSGSVTIRYQQ
jgi:competence protein ComEC